jgi:AcrR family transcriptional regulator
MSRLRSGQWKTCGNAVPVTGEILIGAGPAVPGVGYQGEVFDGAAATTGETMVSEKLGTTGRIRDAARTRTALLDAALGVFGRDGYADAATEEIAAVAGVTRGALYHHFANKRELFRGVIERIQKEAEDALVPIEPFDDPWEAFIGAVPASLDAMYDPVMRRLLLIEAPAVLGWTEVREARNSSLRSIERMLESFETDRSAPSIRAAVRAHLLVAAVEEAMRYLAHSDDPHRDRGVVQTELLEVVQRIRPGHQIGKIHGVARLPHEVLQVTPGESHRIGV